MKFKIDKCKVDKEGIWIAKSELEKLKNQHNKLIARKSFKISIPSYHYGRLELLNEILKLF